jgi:hypothetical protein
MSGYHLDPESNIYERARHKVALQVALMFGRKNLDGTFEDIDTLAASIVQLMAPRDLFKLVYGPDEEVVNRAIWMANNSLDWTAAFNMVRIFAQAAEIALEPDDDVGHLVDRVIRRLKGANPVSPATHIWPTSAAMEQMAAAHVARARPATLADLEAVILPLLGPLADVVVPGKPG